jgi:hypothetical protein
MRNKKVAGTKLRSRKVSKIGKSKRTKVFYILLILLIHLFLSWKQVHVFIFQLIATPCPFPDKRPRSIYEANAANNPTSVDKQSTKLRSSCDRHPQHRLHFECCRRLRLLGCVCIQHHLMCCMWEHVPFVRRRLQDSLGRGKTRSCNCKQNLDV